MDVQGRSMDRCNVCSAPVDRHRDLRWRKDGHDILECCSCGTYFRAELPDRDALREIYGPDYFSDTSGLTRGQGYADYVGEEQNHRSNAAARLRLLRGYQPPGRLLDVGCAAGYFLDEARRQGWRVEGVELAPEMADYGSSTLGLDVHPGLFDEVELEPGAFDVVTMWDYIEHSLDPKGDLDRAAELLRPGGVLAVSTGDAASLAARLSGRRWHLLTPRHHNFFFTRTSLERAFRDAGFQLLTTKRASSLYSVAYLVHKLRTLTDWALVSGIARATARSRLGRIAVPVNLYDIVTVLGRRA
jgi:2-polyprenyl-3-methyl-5-hydroxy-6-metoxy-1,4-benzoquinol methylase